MECQTESSQEQGTKDRPRKNYRRPQLACFGTITEVTAAVGTNGIADGEVLKTS